MSNTLYIFAPLSAMKKRTRLAKLGKFLVKSKIKTTYFGWERNRGELEKLSWDDPLIQEQSLIKGGGYATKLARIMYFIWIPLVFFRCLFLPKGSKIWCLGWESAFPVVIASKLKGFNVIFDDADRFSMLFHLPRPLAKIIKYLERWTSDVSSIHLVPGWSRYSWKSENMMLLRNAPMLEDYESALNHKPGNNEKKKFQIYINGWIAWDTGSRIALKMLNELNNRQVPVELVVAGRIASSEGQALISNKHVSYIGEVSQREALKLYRDTDITLTLYDPAVKINHHAESNKWGDCVFLGTPFIVNSEVLTAKKFVDAGAAISFRYEDYSALADIVENLYRDSSTLSQLKSSLELFREEYQPFETQLKEVMRRVHLKDV